MSLLEGASDLEPVLHLTVPGNLTASVSKAKKVSLSWMASTGNVAVAGYRIYRDGAPVATVNRAPMSASASPLAQGAAPAPPRSGHRVGASARCRGHRPIGTNGRDGVVIGDRARAWPVIGLLSGHREET